jgi:hypothetical protein
MRGKLFSALIATALLGASTAAAAQSTANPVAPEPSTERLDSTDGSALGNAEVIGTVFGLLVIVVLIWKLGNKDDLVVPPTVPTSP